MEYLNSFFLFLMSMILAFLDEICFFFFFQDAVLALDLCDDLLIEKLIHHLTVVEIQPILAHQVIQTGDELALIQPSIKVCNRVKYARNVFHENQLILQMINFIDLNKCQHKQDNHHSHGSHSPIPTSPVAQRRSMNTSSNIDIKTYANEHGNNFILNLNETRPRSSCGLSRLPGIKLVILF